MTDNNYRQDAAVAQALSEAAGHIKKAFEAVTKATITVSMWGDLTDAERATQETLNKTHMSLLASYMFTYIGGLAFEPREEKTEQAIVTEGPVN